MAMYYIVKWTTRSGKCYRLGLLEDDTLDREFWRNQVKGQYANTNQPG